MSVNNNLTLSYELLKCNIVTALGEMDFRPIMAEFNYFEDIFANGISGYMIINDSMCFQNKLSWCGDEFLKFTINKPGNPTPINKIARIYNIAKRHLTNDDNENYILYFCSEEYFLSEETKISKSYTNVTISDIVKDIAYNFLKIPEEEFPDDQIEKTLGKYHIIIPNFKPLEAINWLATMAISKELPNSLQSGASYLFWQNRDGFHFTTLLDIFNRTNKNNGSIRGWSQYNGYGGDGSGYWYGVKNTDDGQWNKNYYSGDQRLGKLDPAEQIISYMNLNSYNTMESVQNGMYANRLIAVDYIKRTHTNNDFNYEKYFDYLKDNIDLYKNWNIFPFMSNAVDRYNLKHNQHPKDILKVAPTDGINKVEITIPYRYAQIGLLGVNRYKISIPGDPNIKAGDIIYLHMPQTAKDEGGWKLKDRFFSGRYLITTVRHKLDQENNFETILELCKDSFTKVNEFNGLIDFNNSDPKLIEVRTKDTFDIPQIKVIPKSPSIQKSNSTQSNLNPNNTRQVNTIP